MTKLPEKEAPEPEDVSRGLRFNHIVEMQTWHRMAELSAQLNALVEALAESGAVDRADLERRRLEAEKREQQRTRRAALVVINDIPDKYALEELPEIDCEARLPLCRARCCTYPVVLSVQDLDERVLRWDYGRPYVLGQRPDGYCVHNSTARACEVYADRPAVCRTFDCREDKRIWIDFERRIPAP